MNFANWFTQSPLIETLGGAILHSLWQDAVIAILLALALRVLRGRSAALRYVVCCAAMTLMLVAPALTLAVALPSPSPATALPDAAPLRLLPYTAVVETMVHSPLGPMLPWIVAVWIAGVSILSLRILGGILRVRNLTRNLVGPVTAAIQENAAILARRMGVTRAVSILQSTLAEVPSVIGWIKPVILIPAGVLTGLSAKQMESLLAHEFAHILRYDYLVNLAQTAVETLLFYHPAVWWTSRQIRKEREHCCDDLAVSACGDTLTYARALTELERMRGAETQLAMAATGGDLTERIHRLLIPPTQPGGSPSSSWLALCVAALVLAGAVATRPTHAQETSEAVVDTLFGHLHAHNWVVEGEVKLLLDQIESSGNIRPFLTALQSRSDWQSREKAAWVLGITRNSGAVDSLVVALRDGSPSVRHTSAWALGMIGDPRAIDPLIANLKDSSYDARASAAWALGRIGDARAVDFLIPALRESASDLRAAAAWALGMIGDPRAADALTAALNDDRNPEFRKKAAEALARLRR